MPITRVNDIDVYYEITGEGEPLALIGGSLFGRFNWGLVLNKLSKHFRVISYDMRGYGQSSRPIQEYTIELWADDLAGLLDALKISKTHVAGTSMGGMIALKFAAKYPEKLLGVVADCAFAKPDRQRKMLLQTWRKLAQTTGLGDIFSDLVMTQAVGSKFLDGPNADEAIEMTRRIVRLNSVETVVQACLAMEEMDLSNDLPKIKAPTLLMNAPGDVITPLDMGPTGIGGRKIHQLIPGSRLKVWEGIGHADLLEKPEESAETIIQFLKSSAQKS
ncbi:MAG: alpha/beta fold hydrolase [Candidatus Bathyarchaeia archaeon]